ncbi:MAG: long-chain fatty acid--CoA ligase, partial [Halobacteriales archaeon]|nr:long-chain fatty acid--CoA ligase [Halobacteriales archaeon]
MSFPLDAPVHALCSDRQPQDREALRFAWAGGRVERWTFGELARASRGVALDLRQAGVQPGDRVAVVLPQCPLAPALHVALSRLGAVSVPLSPIFGPDGLAARLQAAQPRLAVVHASRAEAVREAMPTLPVRGTDGALGHDGPAALPEESARGGDAPWSLMFTSGTTAQPKGVLLPHRVIPGRMAGFHLAHPGFPQAGD